MGMVMAILVMPQLVTLAETPPTVTVPVPWVPPKLVPVTVTAVPPEPVVGASNVIAGVTVKLEELLACPPAVSTTPRVPAVTLFGIVMTTEEAPQLVTVALMPPTATVLVPWTAPKLVPLSVTLVPPVPVTRERLESAGTTVNVDALLA